MNIHNAGRINPQDNELMKLKQQHGELQRIRDEIYCHVTSAVHLLKHCKDDSAAIYELERAIAKARG